jgi:hypothetical protein
LTLGESAFEGCSLLSSIYLPSSVEAISSFCFRDGPELVLNQSRIWDRNVALP